MAKIKGKARTLWTVVILVVVAAVAGLVYANRQQSPTPNDASDPYRPKAEEGKSTQPSATSNGSTPSTATPSPIPTSSAPQSSKGGEVVISSPTQGATVTSGTVVSGTAKTSATRIYYRLKGAKSGQLALGSIAFPGNPSTSTAYSFELLFTNQVAVGGDQGVLGVFVLGTDGLEQAIANVTVNIQP